MTYNKNSLKNLAPQFIKGQVANPEGRPKLEEKKKRKSVCGMRVSPEVFEKYQQLKNIGWTPTKVLERGIELLFDDVIKRE